MHVCTFQIDLQLYLYMYLERKNMYMYFEKVSVVFLYIMQHLDTILEQLNIKCLQMHVQYLQVILTLNRVSGA